MPNERSNHAYVIAISLQGLDRREAKLGDVNICKLLQRHVAGYELAALRRR